LRLKVRRSGQNQGVRASGEWEVAPPCLTLSGLASFALLPTCVPFVNSCSAELGTSCRLLGQGLQAHQLQSQSVHAIQDSVQVGLIHNLTRKDRLTPGIPDLHLLEGHGETLAQLSANHYPVGCSLAATVRAVSIHATLPDDRYRRTPRASPADISHPGELEHAPPFGLRSSARRLQRLVSTLRALKGPRIQQFSLVLHWLKC
jgi:hypothetical protein